MDKTREIFERVARVGYFYRVREVLEVWASNQFPEVLSARIDPETWDLYITVANGEVWRFKEYLMGKEYLKDTEKWGA